MRRKDREVADLEGQLAILEQCPVCRVAINDPASGVPYLVPLNFGMAAGPQSLTLYFHCAPVGTKLDLLRADPNVSFEADCPGTVSGGATSCTYGMNYQSVPQEDRPPDGRAAFEPRRNGPRGVGRLYQRGQIDADEPDFEKRGFRREQALRHARHHGPLGGFRQSALPAVRYGRFYP